jgi:Zn finger protein HypA/HybF involved in hydrogenase expression
MKIKLSKKQWEDMGRRAGWMKTASRKCQCKECEKTFDEEECMSESGVLKGCPECGSKYIKRV